MGQQPSPPRRPQKTIDFDGFRVEVYQEAGSLSFQGGAADKLQGRGGDRLILRLDVGELNAETLGSFPVSRGGRF